MDTSRSGLARQSNSFGVTCRSKSITSPTSFTYKSKSTKSTNSILLATKNVILNSLCYQKMCKKVDSWRRSTSKQVSSPKRKCEDFKQSKEIFYTISQDQISHGSCYSCGSNLLKSRTNKNKICHMIPKCNTHHDALSDSKYKKDKIQTEQIQSIPSIVALKKSMKHFRAERQSVNNNHWYMDDKNLFIKSKRTLNITMSKYIKEFDSITTTILSSSPTFNDKQLNRRISSASLTLETPFAKNCFYAMNVQVDSKRHKLEPYECEPGVCVPGKCDPYQCEKRIRKRLMKKSSTMTSTGNRSRSMYSETGRTKTQNYKPKQHGEQVSQFQTLPRNKKQAVRVGSTFSFNIDFIKNRSSDTISNRHRQKRNSTSTVTSREERRIKTKGTNERRFGNKDGISQSGVDMKHKGSMIIPKHKRCFCTLQLHKGKEQKGINFKTKKNPNQNIVTYKTHGLNTHKTKRIAPTTKNKKYDTHKTKSISPMYDIKVLGPHECEPNVCVPGKCNPYECLKRIQARNKVNNRGVGTKSKLQSASASSMTSYSREKRKNIQNNRKRIHLQKNKPIGVKSSIRPITRSVLRSGHRSQAVRIGSSFSFNIEFYKDKSLGDGFDSATSPNSSKQPTKTDKKQKNCKKLGCDKVCQGSSDCRDQSSQLNSAKKHGATGTDSLPKRCFCTAKLRTEKARKFAKNKKLRKNETNHKQTFKEINTEQNGSDSSTLVNISGQGLVKTASIVYDRLTGQDTSLVIVGGTDMECNISPYTPQETLYKHIDCEKNKHKALPQYKCAKTCTYCKLMNNSQRSVFMSRGTDNPNYQNYPLLKDGYNKAKPYKLKPYECEPGICIPGECNPYECKKLMTKRLHKNAATEMKDNKLRDKDVQSKTTKMKLRHRNVQLFQRKENQSLNKNYVPDVTSDRQSIRFGSNISFNIEFYKDRTHDNDVSKKPNKYTLKNTHEKTTTHKQDPKCKNTSCGGVSRGVNRMSQFEREETNTKSFGSAMKRCFCTLGLNNAHKQQELKQHKNMKNTSTGTNSHPRLEPSECEPGTCVPGHCNPLQCLKRIQQRLRRSEMDLDMYECEPGVCIPGQCNPHKCLERIKNRGNHISGKHATKCNNTLCTTKDGNVQTKKYTEQKGSITQPLKRCFCTAKLFQQSAVKGKQHPAVTVGRVEISEPTTPFTACNKRIYPEQVPRLDRTKPNIRKTRNKSQHFLNEIGKSPSHNLHNDMKVILPFVPTKYEKYEKELILLPNNEQEKPMKPEVSIMNNKLNKESEVIKLQRKFPYRISSIFYRIVHVFSMENDQAKFVPQNEQKNVFMENLREDSVKKTESERKPQKLIPELRVSRSVKILKSHIRTPNRDNRLEYFPLQSGDTCWSNKRLTKLTVHKKKLSNCSNSLLNVKVTKTNPSIKNLVIKLFKPVRKFFKHTRTTKAEFIDIKVCGIGLKTSKFPTDETSKLPTYETSKVLTNTEKDIKVKNNLVKCSSCRFETKKTTDNSKLCNNTACSISKPSCKEKCQGKILFEVMHKDGKKETELKNDLMGIKLSLKGKRPTAKVATFIDTAGKFR